MCRHLEQSYRTRKIIANRTILTQFFRSLCPLSQVAGLDLNEREPRSGNLRYVPPHLRAGDLPSKQNNNQPGEPRDSYQNNRGGGNGYDRDFNNR